MLLRASVLCLCSMAALLAADPKLAALEQRLAGDERTIAELRTELAQSRAQAASRVDATRSGMDAANRALQTRLDAAVTDSSAKAAVIDTKDQMIEQLRSQLAATAARAIDSTKVAAIAENAVDKAAMLAASRRAQEAAQLRAANLYASTASANAREAVELGESNKRAIEASRRGIEELSRVMEALTKFELVGRRLAVFIAVIILVELCVIFLRFRRS